MLSRLFGRKPAVDNPPEIPAATVEQLILAGQAPPGLVAGRISFAGNHKLEQLPAGIHCQDLNLSGTRLRALPSGLRVDFRLDLSDCVHLETLPPGLTVGTLDLRGCVSLQALPEGLDVCFLDISGCTELRSWPEQAHLRFGRLIAQGCDQLTTLPPWLENMAQLDLRGCSSLSTLPEGLVVSSWIDIAGTAIQSLPNSLEGVELHWRGVPIDERIAFHPETIRATEVLAEQNVERRRVLMERMGYDAFVQEANPRVLDRDQDPGGARRLLQVTVPGDEPLVCLEVRCPSTDRLYMLRVPPQIRSCRKAAAWIAGFDNERDYRPVAET